MKVKGKYEKDVNFITIYCDGVIYTIARATGKWGSRSVGECTGYGVLTLEAYKKMENECSMQGEFELN